MTYYSDNRRNNKTTVRRGSWEEITTHDRSRSRYADGIVAVALLLGAGAIVGAAIRLLPIFVDGPDDPPATTVATTVAATVTVVPGPVTTPVQPPVEPQQRTEVEEIQDFFTQYDSEVTPSTATPDLLTRYFVFPLDWYNLKGVLSAEVLANELRDDIQTSSPTDYSPARVLSVEVDGDRRCVIRAVPFREPATETSGELQVHHVLKFDQGFEGHPYRVQAVREVEAGSSTGCWPE
jgi:hypothetical protein